MKPTGNNVPTRSAEFRVRIPLKSTSDLGADVPMRPPPSTPMVRLFAGFTLIELLVVISIISLLVAMVLPTLGAAKAYARKVRCINNLRQWTVAFMFYKDDYDDFIPHEGSLHDGTVTVDLWASVSSMYNKTNLTIWYNALPPYLVRPSAKDYAVPRSKIPEFYQDRLFHCPSTKFPIGFEKAHAAYFSSAMNSKLIQPPHSSIRFNTIKFPDKTPTFLDERVNEDEKKAHYLQTDATLGQPSASASRFAPRHGGGGNLAFCDGHVAWYAGPSVVETRPGRRLGDAIYPDGKINWCADPIEDPNRRD